MPIQRLSDEVVNRIAAGEILVRPVNAVKELIENSIDAGATDISVLIGQGGLQLIQVSDNGAGIRLMDHALVCERFATSKLTSSDSLLDGSLGSFGFRGEALASMSLVGHVSIFSKAVADGHTHGFESRYLRGELLPNFPAPVPFAGQSGTRIVVEDLFYDHPVKKQSFRSASTEYKKIFELLASFAVACPTVQFRLKKFGELSFDLDTGAEGQVGRIENLFNVRELLRVSDQNCVWPLQDLQCILSSTTSGSGAHIVVVNGRLVELASLSRQIEIEYFSQLQQTGKFFIFLKLEIAAAELDVNVSPTKREVVFSNQAAVERSVIELVSKKLIESKSSKLIKVKKPILFSAIQPLTIKSEGISPAAAVVPLTQFRIHTCPKQVFFHPVPTAPLALTQAPLLLSLSQGHRMESVPKRIRQEVRVDPDISAFAGVARSLLIKSGPLIAQVRNVRNSFVFVGPVTADFAVCQYFQYLCLSNLRFLGSFLVKLFLLNAIGSEEPLEGEEVSGEEIPTWISDLFGGTFLIPIFGTSEGSSELGDFLSQLPGLPNILSEESLDRFLDVLSEFVVKSQFGSLKQIFEEIVKNEKFYLHVPPGSDKVPPLPLSTADSPRFFFRELVSLKELYKEFERC